MQSVKCYIKHEKSRLVSLMKMFLIRLSCMNQKLYLLDNRLSNIMSK